MHWNNQTWYKVNVLIAAASPCKFDCLCVYSTLLLSNQLIFSHVSALVDSFRNRIFEIGNIRLIAAKCPNAILHYFLLYSMIKNVKQTGHNKIYIWVIMIHIDCKSVNISSLLDFCFKEIKICCDP